MANGEEGARDDGGEFAVFRSDKFHADDDGDDEDARMGEAGARSEQGIQCPVWYHRLEQSTDDLRHNGHEEDLLATDSELPLSPGAMSHLSPRMPKIMLPAICPT